MRYHRCSEYHVLKKFKDKKTHIDRFTHQRFIGTQKMNLTLIYNQIVFHENCQYENRKSSKMHLFSSSLFHNPVLSLQFWS